MAALSNFLELELLDHVLRNAAYTPPPTVYVALFTSSASLAELEAGTLTNEVTAGGNTYERQAAAFDVAASGATANTGALTWNDMPAVTVGYVAIMDASTAGNVLFGGPLTTPRTLSAGDTFAIAAGALDVTMA